MSYRTLLCAGAFLGIVGMGVSSAQVGPGVQQERERERGQTIRDVAGDDAREVLQLLEGEWEVEVKIYNLSLLEEAPDRPMRPGQIDRPTPRPGERDFDRPGTGQQPGQQQQQIQQQLQQAFTRAGVDRMQAEQEARNLAQQWVRQRPEQQQIQQQLEQTMTRHGVSREQAQREARNISQQVHRLLAGTPERPGVGPDRDRPGIDPERDPTADPPGVPGQRRPMVDPGEAELSAQGRATRQFILNENILEEEIRFSQASPDQWPDDWNDNPQHRGEEYISLREDGLFEGRGLFGYNPGNLLSHAWASNTGDSMVHYSLARFEPTAHELTFMTIDAQRLIRETPRPRPGITPRDEPRRPGEPMRRPGQPDYDNDNGNGQVGQDRPGLRPRPDRPGAEQPHAKLDTHGTRSVLRIISKDEHVVEFYKANGMGQAERVMDVTYTRTN